MAGVDNVRTFATAPHINIVNPAFANHAFILSSHTELSGSPNMCINNPIAENAVVQLAIALIIV